MAKQLYEGEINEFTDWITGVDSTTGEKVTELEISGGSIRNLLQNRLVKPFYGHFDEGAGLCYLFSSKKAYDIWANESTPEDLKNDLVLFSFNAPSLYSIQKKAPNGSYYMRNGDSTSNVAKVLFSWQITYNNAPFSDGIVATYTITNQVDKTIKTFSKIYSSIGKSYDSDGYIIENPENIYDYLKEGTNSIQVVLKSQSTSAVTSFSFEIILITLTIDSGFSFYRGLANLPSLSTSDKQIEFNAYITRNVSLTVNVYVEIDGVKCKNIPAYVNNDVPHIFIDEATLFGTASNLLNLAAGQHGLKLYALQVIEDRTITSNYLYYTFMVIDQQHSTIAYTNINYVASFSLDPGDLISDIILQATQYETFSFSWGYYINDVSNTSILTDWKLHCIEGIEETYIDITTLEGNSKEISLNLVFVPTIHSEKYENIYLEAYNGSVLLLLVPMLITKSTLNVNEPDGYDFYLSAFGKVNSNTLPTWEYRKGASEVISTTFYGVLWNQSSGWYDNSLRLKGTNLYAIIGTKTYNDGGIYTYLDYNIFRPDGNDDITIKDGIAVEVDFEAENVSNTDDVLLLIGDETSSCFKFTPNSAGFYIKGDEIVKTNYKANERNKICFIIYPHVYSSDPCFNTLAVIVTNGILERAASYGDSSTSLSTGYGQIKIGGTNSGIRLYSIRCYRNALSYLIAYDNFIYDSDNKVELINKNNVLVDLVIDKDACASKIDVIELIAPKDVEDLKDIAQIIETTTTSKEDSKVICNIIRTCPSDATKNFTITHGLIRKHGLSTLDYAVPSFKIWSNTNEYKDTYPPVIDCASQKSLGLNKNRYKMKDSSIPCNKWVLQANYADSSGVHNGGLLRIIQKTWYDAKVYGLYVLRTPPQLFASGAEYTMRDGTQLGFSNIVTDPVTGRYKTWQELNVNSRNLLTNSKDFPYTIRIAPDSFPCVVFYTNKNDKTSFLGLYVFMDDKKSDTLYGERSIYKFKDDPFCLTSLYKDSDKKANRVWDNDKVLRIEVLNINTLFTSYMKTEKGSDPDTVHFTDWIIDYTKDKFDNDVVSGGHYAWQEDFELIYPDPDDVTYKIDPLLPNHEYGDLDSLENESKSFEKVTAPFVKWVNWLTSTFDQLVSRAILNNTITLEMLNNSEGFLTFIRTADLHLDVYKLAAYYIFVLRFGLVDSLERNAQIKTYDGQHFWYEPWDMDIALGNQNTGGIRFEPPITRDTKLDQRTWALSGRSLTTSNWLFDALENWTEWRSVIVPKVAQALYEAGLTYDYVTEMFDANYASAWSEIVYNKSGYFKYIQQGKLVSTNVSYDDKLYAWLLGARTPHRHWWLSTSFDYYDALWTVGDFKTNKITIKANHTLGEEGYLKITPRASTFFSIDVLDTNIGTQQASLNSPAVYDFTTRSVTTKTPVAIYGATFIQELDISLFAKSFDHIELAGAYSKELGASIKKFDLGNKLTPDYNVSISLYTSDINMVNCDILNSNVYGDPLEALEVLNLRGLMMLTSTAKLLNDSDRHNVHTFLGMGTGLTLFSSSKTGNAFIQVELPVTVKTISLYNSTIPTTYGGFTFWETVEIPSGNYIDYYDDNGVLIDRIELMTGLHTKYQIPNLNVTYHIPPTVTEINLLGSTGRLECSKILIKDWLKCIEAQNGDYSTKTLKAYNVNWEGFTYDELAKIAQMNSASILTGYICLTDTPTAEQVTQLMLWFGTTIFIKGSSGLVIDYETETTVITFDSDGIYSGLNNDPKTFYYNGKNIPLMFLHEGYTGKNGNGVYINATKFRLRDVDSSRISWRVLSLTGEEGGNSLQFRSVSINSIQAGKNSLGVQQYNRYVIAQPSNERNDYIVILEASISYYDEETHQDLTMEEYIAIKIIVVTYPEQYTISIVRDNLSQNFREFGKFVSFYDRSSKVELYAAPSSTDFTAELKSVTYTIRKLNSIADDAEGTTLLEFDPYAETSSYTALSDYSRTLDSKINVYAGQNNKTIAGSWRPIKITVSDNAELNNSIPDLYEVVATIEFNATNANTLTCSKTFIVLKESSDSAAVTSYNQMFTPLTTLFYQNYNLEINQYLYMSHLYVLKGELIAKEDVNTAKHNIGTVEEPEYVFDEILTNNPKNHSIFEYCVNLEGIDLSNSPNITHSKVVTVNAQDITVYQLVFPETNKITSLKTNNCTALDNLDYQYLTSLVTLELQNCPSITSIDLTNNTNLLDIKLSGCTGLTAMDITHCTKLRTLDVTGTTALSSITLPTSSLFESVKFGNPSTINIPPVSLSLLIGDGDNVIDDNNEWSKPVTDATKSKISFTSVSNLSSITLNAGDNGVGAISTLCRILDAKYNNGGA